MGKKIVCIGEILWDMLPTGAKAGGAPMNVALHLKKLGLNSIFAGRVGDDRLGTALKDFLIKQEMDINLIQTDPRFPTSTVEVILNSDHQVSYEIIDNVAWDRLELTNELKLACAEADVLVYGTLASRHALTNETIISLLDNPCLKVIDINLRPPFINQGVVEQLLLKSDIAKLNDEELKLIGSWHNQNLDLIDLTKWFAEKFKCHIVCITRGSRGALVFNHEEILEHPGYSVKVVDTVGSGDAFLAGFLATFQSGKSLIEALDFACATGALVATKAGGTPTYKLSDIQRIIKSK